MKRFLIWFFVVLTAVTMAIGAVAYYIYSSPATSLSEPYQLLVSPGDGMGEVMAELQESCGLMYPFLFEVIAKKMKVPQNIRPGLFVLKPEMNMREIALVLRRGGTLTADVVIRGTQDYTQVLGAIASKLEPDLQSLLKEIENDTQLALMGFDNDKIPALFIPNTYNMYYFSTPSQIIQKLIVVFNDFWTPVRRNQAASLNLSPIEVSILASIVDKETTKVDEMPRVAGVYLNRLAINQKLQADPTVKYAVGDPTLKRVLTKHTLVEHPYNTYYVHGLPPGPICVPSLQAIQAVLHAEDHKFYYFCAKPDFSGYHSFAENHDQHLVNRRKYQQFLNKNNIK